MREREEMCGLELAGLFTCCSMSINVHLRSLLVKLDTSFLLDLAASL